jgi:protein-disulfide isomerase
VKTLALVVAWLAAAPALAQTARLDTTQLYRVPVDGAPTRGPRGAKVTIVEFGEYHCPYCAKAQATLKELEKLYPGEIRIVFRHRIVHRATAIPPAEAAVFAHREGKFWEMHEELLSDIQATRTRDGLEAVAERVGLDLGRLRKGLTARTWEATVMNDDALAVRFGVQGTPTFFLNGRPLSGARPLADFQAIVDAELDRASALLAKGVSRNDLYDRLTAQGLGEIEAPPPPPPKKTIPVEIERTIDALEACRDGNVVMARIAFERLTGARRKLVQGDCKAMGVDLSS